MPSKMAHAISDHLEDPEHLFGKAEKYEEAGHFKNAFHCLLRAARSGHTSSQINLGSFYSAGTGVNKNAKSAAYWYREAYKSGRASGAFNLAINKRNAGDIRGAMRWFEKAAAMDDGDAFIELARIYMTRRGGKDLAIDLLRKTQTMHRDQISDDSKQEAGSLLSKLTGVFLLRR